MTRLLLLLVVIGAIAAGIVAGVELFDAIST